MRNILLAAGVAGLVGLFTACGSKDHPAVADDSPQSSGGTRTTIGGSHSTAGKTGTMSDGGAGGEAPEAANSPLVKIIEPADSQTPDDGVLLGQTAHVVCTVEESHAIGAAPINATTVAVSILDAAGKMIETKPAPATKNANEYAADFVTATVASGRASFVCSAQDENKVEGTDSVSTFIDHGPTITVASPLPESANPLKGGLAVKFSVEPTLLSQDDAGAQVDHVTFALDGKTYETKETSGTFETSIALDALVAPPTGAITITATNKRSPESATAIKSYNIVIDGDGPVISIQSPLPNEVKGGKVTIAFTVTDKGSGVDPTSVNVARYLSDKPQFYDPDKGWAHNGDAYTFTFDTKDIAAYASVQTTINVRASDKVGNSSANGQSVQIYLDNVAPQVDLDPKNIRMKAGDKTCSNSFDPVGRDAVDDLEGVSGQATLTRYAWFRAFVWERTNSAQGQDLHYYSGTDPAQVRLYIQASPNTSATKLLVNRNPGEDDTCDDIGGIQDIVSPPKFSALVGLPASGVVWHQSDATEAPAVTDADCKVSDGPEPDHLCTLHDSDMWFAPQHDDGAAEPAVYAVGPGAGESCAGVDIEFLSLDQADGWVCAAARAVDKAGNVGISPPIRLCVDSPDIDGQPDCAIMSTTPPTCTDGCTPPARGGGFIVVMP